MEVKAFGDPFFRSLPCIVTIGMFDGLHVGHMTLIRRCVALSRSEGCSSVVVTFSANPKTDKNGKPVFRIISDKQTDEILQAEGVDFHCVIDFTDEFKSISGRDFIKLLLSYFNFKGLVVGQDFRCGAKSFSIGSDVISQVLKQYCKANEPLPVFEIMPVVMVDGVVVSSTEIRRLIAEGNFEKVGMLLGRAYNGECDPKL